MTDELKHYGVVGMKWGVHRYKRMEKSNARLQKKALNYDIKSAKLRKKSEKAHAENDLEGVNKAATKAANYQKKSAKLQKKSLKETSEFKKRRLEKKASKAAYKGAVQQMKANRLSKETGYGAKAMNYSIKSDKIAAKAAKARMKLASNKAYMAALERKINSCESSKVSAGKEIVDQLTTKSKPNK